MTNTSSENSLVAKLYPWGMGQSEIVLQNDFGDAGTLDSEEISDCSNGIINPDNAAINIEHSSDVIIGPVTQFHGPVTIFQNVNGNRDAITGFENLENNVQFKAVNSTKSCEYSANEDVSKKAAENYLGKFIKLAVAILFILIAVMSASMYFGMNSRFRSDERTSTTTEVAALSALTDISNNTIISENSNKFRLICRDEWGDRPIKSNTKPLLHPTPTVIISHTGGGFCSTLANCSNKAVSLQSLFVGKGEPDIGYNFFIGGDGNAYVARGWDITNHRRPNSIEISFIGNFNFDELSADMIKITKNLLEQGVKSRKLASNYTLLCHNQIAATQSPGINVLNEVKTWSHWKPTN